MVSPPCVSSLHVRDCYRGMFVNMEGLWCKWVLTDLQVCVGAGDSNVARSALNILQHLTNNHHHKVKPLGIILMVCIWLFNCLSLSVTSNLNQNIVSNHE